MQKTGLDAFYLPDHDVTIVSHQHWILCPIYVYLCFVILALSFPKRTVSTLTEICFRA